MYTENAGASGDQFYLKGGTAGNTDQVLYSLKYDGNPLVITSGTAVVVNNGTKTTKAGMAPKTLAISVTGEAQNPDADTYSDTIYMKIAAK